MAQIPESRRSEAARPIAPAPVAEPDSLQPTVAPTPPPAGALAVTPADPDAAPAYDPAEYRWVPVRRRPRLDGWTEEKQRRFIETVADTGLVGQACKVVGMSRASAYRLRRSPHGAAFARAWDAARQHAGGLIEDIAFERAIEGVEHEVYNGNGEVVGAKLQYDSRLLQYLLTRLKPERYGPRPMSPAQAAAPVPRPPALDDSLRAMEPALPAPPEQLMAPDDLETALEIADIADGTLPGYLNEQRPPRTDAQVRAAEADARMARGKAALEKREAGGTLTEEEFADECFHLDPAANAMRRRRPRG